VASAIRTREKALGGKIRRVFETILNSTALPNLHPAVVHFPIALLPVAILFDLVVLWRRHPLLDRVTAALYTVAALSAWAAVWAGEEAAESLSGLAEPLQAAVEEHSDWAHWFLYAVAVVALARLALAWQARRRERIGMLPARLIALLAALGVSFLMVGAADRGGALVYRSGVSVMAVPAPAPEVSPRLPETPAPSRP
jgi:uncharacterized membrane protein